MKRIFPLIVAMIFTVVFTSCGKKVLFEESRTFSNDTWLRFQPEHFDVQSVSTDNCYNFFVTLTIDTARYRENALPIIMELESPDHENRTLFSTILLRNREGAWLGSFNDNGNLVISQQVRQFHFFNTTGKYSLNLGQRTNKYEIHGIRQLDLRIEKTELEYPE